MVTDPHLLHINFAKGFRGGERQTQLLVEELACRGWSQKLLVRRGSDLGKRLRDTPRLAIVEVAKPYLRGLGHFADAHLVHAHETKGAQLALAAHLLLRKPYLVTRRVDIPISDNFFNRTLYHKAAYAVALSRAIRSEILKIAPCARVPIIPSAYSGIPPNPARVNAITSRFAEKFLVGHVGALVDAHKGQTLILEAARALRTTHPHIHFLLLGRGEDESRLKAMAKELPNVTFEGFVHNVSDYIAAMDLFIFPSRHEGLGSTILDAMQLGRPVVATRVGGIPDIVDDTVDGLLIPPGDASALKEAIVRLHDDPAMRLALAHNARKKAESFSPRAMADRYVELYRKTLSSPTGRSL